MKNYLLSAGSSLVWLLFAASSAQSQDVHHPDYYPSDYSAIVESSRSEGGLLIYSNISAENWQKALDRFREIYPWISVETLDLSSSTIHSRAEAESGSSARTADFLVSTATDRWINYAQEGVFLENYSSPELPHLEDFANPAPGVYIMSSDPSLIVYNKKLMSEDQAPTGLASLAAAAKADPNLYAGKITSGDVTRSAASAAHWWSILTDLGEEGWESLRVIGPMMKPETSVGQMVEKIASGEYLVGYSLGAPSVFPVLDGAGGELLGIKYPDDGTLFILRAMGIPKAAQNPNSARLMLDFILSHEGQTLFGQSGMTPHRPDVDEAEVPNTFQSVVEALAGGRIVLQSFRPAMLDEIESFKDKWGKIVLGGGQ